MIFSKKIVLSLLFVFSLILTINVSAELSLKAENISNVSPKYITDLVVEDEGEGVRISGKTANNKNVTKYLQFLNESVGFPSLENVRLEDKKSVFVILIKKFKK